MNILALTLAYQRVEFLKACMFSAIRLGGYLLLYSVDWRAALGLFLLEWAWNGQRLTAGGSGAT